MKIKAVVLAVFAGLLMMGCVTVTPTTDASPSPTPTANSVGN